MENFKKFLSKYGAAIVFGVAFILFLGFFALPMLNFIAEEEWIVGEEEFARETLQSLSGYSLFGANKLNFLDRTLDLGKNIFVELAFIVVLIATVIGAITYALTFTNILKKDKVKKGLFGTTLGIVLIGLVMLLAVEKISSDWPFAIYPDDQFVGPEGAVNYACEIKIKFNDLGSTLVIVSVFLMAFAILREVLAETKFSTKEIVEFGVLVALAVILDKLPVFDLTVGAGSINLSGIPLMILAVRHGPLKGFFAGSVIFGLLTCLIDGYGVQTYPFDYFIAFSGYALAGLGYNIFSKYILKSDKQGFQVANIIIAFLFGGIGILCTRMIGGTISSMVLYDYEFVAALNYNILYVGPSAGFVTAICIALAYPICLINRLFPVNKKVITEEVTETSEETIEE